MLKLVSSALAHKSDLGAVLLNLRNAEEVRAGFRHLNGVATGLGVAVDGVLIEQMITDAVEVVVGLKRDPQFGPTVMVGAGGVLVELIGDIEVALAPLSAAMAEAMLKRLRVWPLLQGFRGHPRRDISAVVDALVKLGQLAAALEGRLLELDVNPLLVGREGEGAVAADARAVLS